MTRYQLEIFEYSNYAQKSFPYVAEALTPLPRLGTFSWIVTRDSHQKYFSIPNLGRGPPGRGARPTSGPRPVKKSDAVTGSEISLVTVSQRSSLISKSSI